MRLKDKVAIVTGGGSGMGRATVERFVAEGARVVVADRSGQEKDVATALGAAAVPFNADMAELDQVERLFDFVRSEFGALHILFNNAGTDGKFASIFDASEENFDRLMNVNVRAILIGTKLGARIMKESGGGSIINTSSTSALRFVEGASAYAASKAAIFGINRTAAVELAPHNIRVNTICPGPIDTPMLREVIGEAGMDRMREIVPGKRLGAPSEIASVVAFLASDDASFVTGTVIPVDGGQIC